MLTRLRAARFKAWKDSGELRLAPITVLFGANSAGKTSISQLLLLLRQTVESPDRARVLHFGDSRTPVDLGGYREIAFGHDTSAPLEIALEWTLDTPLTVSDPLSGNARRGDRLRFEVTLRADEREQPEVTALAYTLSEGADARLSTRMTRRADGSYALDASGYDVVLRPERSDSLPRPSRFYGFPEEAVAHYQNTSFVSDLVLALERELRRVHYVGPLREYPKSLYLWSGDVPEHVGERGERVIEAILAGGGRSFDWAADPRPRSLPEVVAERLRDMGLIHELEVRPIGEHRREHEVWVKTGAHMPRVRLTDVGFGVSQVLPVVVESFFVPPRSVVIFEQPELHLHPKVQADLADLFVDAIRAREGGEERHVQFLIESHSEHFLRRLQRRIAEERLAPEDAALYFVGGGAEGASVEALEVDAFGNILNWPEGFFGDEMADLVARAEAQAKRAGRGYGA